MLMIKKYFDLKLLLFSILSAFVLSIAVTTFAIPGNIYPGGFSGIARILSDVSNEYFSFTLSYSLIYFTLNALSALLVFKRIGKKFAIYSIIQFIFVSIFTSFLKPVMTLNNELLYCIFGGIVNGLGVGLALMNNFSSGGFDFLSIYFSNKYKKSFWNHILFINASILVIAGFIFGWQRALYSIIYQYCSTEVIKKVHRRYTHQTLTVITSKPNEVSNEIQSHVRHGITEIHSHGHYSNTDNTLLYMVINSYQTRDVVTYINKIDPHAFINVQDSIEIYGNYYQKPLD